MDVDAVVLDIDGVLVDTADSYIRAIIETIKAIYNASIDREFVQRFKDAGGFNNDWLATDGIALYILARRAGFDTELDAFTDTIAARGGGLATAQTIVAESLDEQSVTAIHRTLDPGAHRRTFQWLYLGPDRYRTLEDEPVPTIAPEPAGFINDEPILIDQSSIDALQAHGPVGILTGRPRAEAEIALSRLGLSIPKERQLTMDDWDGGKPDPAGLIRVASACDATRTLYVGDELDDVRTAVNANTSDERCFIGVGVLTGGVRGRCGIEQFREAGATAVLESVNDVPRLITGAPVDKLATENGA